MPAADADGQGLVGDGVEIGTKLRVPGETLGKIAIGRIGEAGKQKQHEGRRLAQSASMWCHMSSMSIVSLTILGSVFGRAEDAWIAKARCFLH